jgi:hypothetical protein
MATYYKYINFTTPLYSGIDDRIDLSNPSAKNKSVAIRWIGLIRPNYGQEYTMFATVSRNEERLRLWVDNSLVIDMWNSISGTEGSGSVSFGIALEYFNIVIEYKHQGGYSGAQLKWLNSLEFDKSIIPSIFFFFGMNVQGSPFILQVQTTLPNNLSPIQISSDLSKFLSSAANSSLVAGTILNIFLSAVDAYGNILFNACELEPELFCKGFPFSVYAIQESANRRKITSSVKFTSDRIQNSLLLTKSGLYRVYIEVLDKNGLKATAHSRCKAGITHNAPSEVFFVGSMEDKTWMSNSSYYCLQFSGILFSPLTGQVQFQLKGSTPAQLRVADILLTEIDEITQISISSLKTVANTPYSFCLDMQRTPGGFNVSLLWRTNFQSDFVSISQQYYFTRSVALPGAPYRLTVVPAHICATKSKISGIGATISYISKPSHFSIVAKDEYSNALSTGGQDFSFRIVRNETSIRVRDTQNVIAQSEFWVIDHKNGRYSITYVVNETAEVPSKLEAYLPAPYGLAATYFPGSYSAQDSGLTSRLWSTIDFSFSDNNQSPESASSAQPFMLRWAGFIKPNIPQVYTIFAAVLGADERLRLWVDNSLVVDMWDNFSATEQSGTVLFGISKSFYELVLEYRQYNGSGGVRLSWKSSNFSKVPISSTFLFLKLPLYGTPTALHIHGVWSYFSVSSVAINGGTQIMIAGSGFDERQNYTLLFSGNDSALSIPVYPTSSNALIAYSPPWNSDNSRMAELLFSAEGRDFVKIFAEDQSILFKGNAMHLWSTYFLLSHTPNTEGVIRSGWYALNNMISTHINGGL